MNARDDSDYALDSLIRLYLLRCEVEGKSPNTVSAYKLTLGLFSTVAREEGFPEDVREIDLPHLYTYPRSLLSFII